MIIGDLVSADGGTRRKGIRTTHVVDFETKEKIVKFLIRYIDSHSTNDKWFSINTFFHNIPEDIEDTPLKALYIASSKKFVESKSTIEINTRKYIGICFREALYRSDNRYIERMNTSIKEYSKVK